MNDIIEEHYGATTCQHNLNRSMCYQCTGKDDPITIPCELCNDTGFVETTNFDFTSVRKCLCKIEDDHDTQYDNTLETSK